MLRGSRQHRLVAALRCGGQVVGSQVQGAGDRLLIGSTNTLVI